MEELFLGGKFALKYLLWNSVVVILVTIGNYCHYIKCEKYFSILNCLGVAHVEIHRRTDRQPLAVIVHSNISVLIYTVCSKTSSFSQDRTSSVIMWKKWNINKHSMQMVRWSDVKHSDLTRQTSSSKWSETRSLTNLKQISPHRLVGKVSK